MEARLGAEGRRRMEELRRELEAAPTGEARDELLTARGALAGRAQAYEPIEATDDLPSLPADARGHEETWNDVLRLQTEGVEPAAFAAIRAPVLMLHGDADPHPGPATRDVLRRSIPQLEYIELARCGHTPWLERHTRDAFLTYLRPWLRAH
jgi:pimeloyl-ACP methyl ester carboxylesterase